MEQWLGMLTEKLLFGEINIDFAGTTLKSRFSVPQAQAAFIASAASPKDGLLPEELLECVARSGVAKYQSVTQMSDAQRIKAFIDNLKGEMDEDQVMRAAAQSAG